LFQAVCDGKCNISAANALFAFYPDLPATLDRLHGNVTPAVLAAAKRFIAIESGPSERVAGEMLASIDDPDPEVALQASGNIVRVVDFQKVAGAVTQRRLAGLGPEIRQLPPPPASTAVEWKPAVPAAPVATIGLSLLASCCWTIVAYGSLAAGLVILITTAVCYRQSSAATGS
jgi:hypothetical protein